MENSSIELSEIQRSIQRLEKKIRIFKRIGTITINKKKKRGLLRRLFSRFM